MPRRTQRRPLQTTSGAAHKPRQANTIQAALVLAMLEPSPFPFRIRIFDPVYNESIISHNIYKGKPSREKKD